MFAPAKILTNLNNPPPKPTTSYSGVAATGSATSCSTSSSFTATSPQTFICALTYSYSLSSTGHTCTWNGQALTPESTALEGTYIRSVLWGLQVPSTALNTASVFSMTGGSGYLGLIAWPLLGVFKATGGFGANGSSTLPAVTVTSGAGQLVVGGIGCWGTPTPVQGTQIGSTLSGTDLKVMALYAPYGTPPNTLSASQTSNFWTAVGMTLKTISV